MVAFAANMLLNECMVLALIPREGLSNSRTLAGIGQWAFKQ
jgi:hypothetical protein